MSNLNNIKVKLNSLESLSSLTVIFQQVALIKMNEIRNQVLLRKDFFNDIWELYSNIKSLEKHYKRNTLYENAVIIISSDYGLLGNMNEKIINFMLNDKINNPDIFVIGEKGKNILRQKKIKFRASYSFEEEISLEFVSKILDDIKNYSNIAVYYEEFISISAQKPKKMYLNFDSYKQGFRKKDVSSYLFEPSFESILSSLESVMIGMMFTQILYESHLSQYAARMVRMSNSSDKSKDLLKKERANYIKMKRRLSDDNMKLIFNNFMNNEQQFKG